jgi:hypothetical protein
MMTMSAASRQGVGKKCAECRKYSRNTFYCSREHKVLAQDKEACASFAPRESHRPRMRKF